MEGNKRKSLSEMPVNSEIIKCLKELEYWQLIGALNN